MIKACNNNVHQLMPTPDRVRSTGLISDGNLGHVYRKKIKKKINDCCCSKQMPQKIK